MFTAERYCEMISGMSQQRKSEACRMNRGVADTDSFVSVAYGDDVMTVDGVFEGNPIENLPKVLDLVLKTGVIQFDALSFTAEVFMKRIDALSAEERERVAREYKRGDLEKEYKENPLTDVVEGMFTVVITWAGETAFSFVEVKYDDKGQPVFVDSTDGTQTPQVRMSGFCKELLDDYRKHCRRELESEEGELYAEAFAELVREEGSLAKAVDYIAKVRNSKDD